jgi:hypothetical protein
MVKNRLVILIILIFFLLPKSSVLAGTILSSYKYAWSSNSGYINFENVLVDDNSLSGYAWSENAGWIKFDPAQGGVINDGHGNLSGYAWGESLGWINFSSTTINVSTGRLHGSATGDLVGTINFDYPNYCDVRTDWRIFIATSTPPVVNPTSVSGSVSSGGSGGGFYSTMMMNLFGKNVHIDSHNDPLIISPLQSGTLNKDTDNGQILVDVPAGIVADDTAFTVEVKMLDDKINFLIGDDKKLINNSFYDITAVNKDGIAVHNFSKPITITLPIGKDKIGLKNLRLYWLNEKNWKWVLIPDAVFSNDKVVFKVSHLTRFAIFSENNESIGKKKVSQSISLPGEKKDLYINSTSSKVKFVSSQDFENKKESSKSKSGVLALLALVLIVFVTIVRRKKIK